MLKLLSAGLAVVLLLSLAGCQSASSQTKSPEELKAFRGDSSKMPDSVRDSIAKTTSPPR